MDHKNLEVWKKSLYLVKLVYKLTEKLPVSERFGLTNQIKRAAISIASNIAEGSGRDSDKEFIQFLYYSVGSITELETQLIISEELGFLEIPDEVEDCLQILRKLIIGLIKYLKSKR